jgi:hypothetical protein
LICKFLFAFSIPLSFNICHMLPISRNLYLFTQTVPTLPFIRPFVRLRRHILHRYFHNFWTNYLITLKFDLDLYFIVPNNSTQFEIRFQVIWNRRVLMFAYFFFSFDTVFLFYFVFIVCHTHLLVYLTIKIFDLLTGII